MAAPQGAYTGLSLYIGDCEHNIAYLDTNYTTMKSRFFLDEVLGLEQGVIGLVNPSGANAARHNLSTRQGKGRVGNYVMLNDAGLNCLSAITAFSMPPELPNMTAESNNVTFVTAYYNGSSGDQYGIMYNESLDPGWKTVTAGADLAANTTLTRKFTIPPMLPNQSVDFKAFITNSEGTIESAIQNCIVFREVIKMSYDDDGPSFGLCGSTKDTDIYIDTEDVEMGTFFFTNTVLTAPAPAGGYSDGTNYYTYDATFGVTAIFSCSTPPSRPYISYISFESSAFAACSLDSTSGNIYYETDGFTTTWFTSPDPDVSTKAATGFYSYMDGATRRVIEVGSAGVQISDDPC